MSRPPHRWPKVRAKPVPADPEHLGHQFQCPIRVPTGPGGRLPCVGVPAPRSTRRQHPRPSSRPGLGRELVARSGKDSGDGVGVGRGGDRSVVDRAGPFRRAVRSARDRGLSLPRAPRRSRGGRAPPRRRVPDRVREARFVRAGTVERASVALRDRDQLARAPSAGRGAANRGDGTSARDSGPGRRPRPIEVVARLDAVELWPHMAEAVAGLPEGERDALLLYVWEDLSYDEIAAALGVPVGTVRSRLNRARPNLARTAARRSGENSERRLRPPEGIATRPGASRRAGGTHRVRPREGATDGHDRSDTQRARCP